MSVSNFRGAVDWALMVGLVFAIIYRRDIAAKT